MKLNNKRRKLREIRWINNIRKFGIVKSHVKVSRDALEDTELIKTIVEDSRDLGLPKRVHRRFSYHLSTVAINRINDDFATDLKTIIKTFKAVEI